MHTARRIFGFLALLAAGLGALPARRADAQGLPHTFAAGTPARAAEVNANFRYVAPRNVVFVSRPEGGTAVDAGSALRAALAPASLAAINGAPGASNPYLVSVAPGIYDLGTMGITIPSYVTLAGAGDASQLVGQVVSPGAGSLTALVRLSSSSELRSIAVRNTAATQASIAVLLTSGTARVVDASVSASGSNVVAAYVTGAATLTLDRCRVSVDAATYVTGAYADQGASLEVLRSSVAATNNGSRATGIERSTTGALLTVRDTEITATNASTLAGTEARGIVVGGTIPAELDDLAVSASGGAIAAAVVTLVNGALRLRGSVARASGGTTGHYALRSTTGATMEIMSSHLDVGSTASDVFLSGGGGTIRVGASRLSSPYYVGTGTVVCVYTYNAAFAATTCSSAPI